MRKYIGLNADFDLSDTSAKAFPDNLKFLQQLLDNCQRCLDKGSTISLSAASFNNRIFHLLFSPVIEDGEVIGVVSIGEDVTEAKILERSKDEFFSIASHELRTPLTAIEGNASLIEQFYKEQLKDESLRSMVSDIKSSSIRLIGIVNDFLDVSRLEQGKMKFRPEPIGTETVIESVVYELSAVSREKQIRVVTTNTLAKLPPVYADQDRLKQVLYNLAGNALKFTDKGQVTFTAKVTGRTMTVYVNDTGRGISPENQQLLFHKFQQANDSLLTRDTTRGTGLGLYISKLIVEHMGGHLRLINSEIGVGSTFAFTVPLAKTKSATSRH